MAMKGAAAWILAMNSSGKIVYWAGVTTTPISDGSTTNPVMINGSSVTIRPGGAVGYNGNEFVLSEDGVWQQFGETDVQHKTLDTPIDVDGTEVTTVESALSAINEYAEDIDESLGTASTKNSTSVVTQSTDLVESGAVKNAVESAYQLVEDTVGWTGKNFLSLADTHNSGDLTIALTGDGGIIVNGTNGDTNATINLMNISNDLNKLYLPKGAYKIVATLFTEPNCFIGIYKNATSGSWEAMSQGGNNIFEVDDGDYVFPRLRVQKNTSFTNKKIYAMIMRADNIDESFEPYHASVADSLDDKMSYADNGVLGAKNILPIPFSIVKALNTVGTWNDNVYTLRQVKFTCTIESGYITKVEVNGTATGADAQFMLYNRLSSFFALKKGTYILNGCPAGGSTSTYRLSLVQTVSGSASPSYDTGSGIKINAVSDNNAGVNININNTVTANHLEFYPMLRLASDTDPTYQPYAETNIQLTNSKLSYKDNTLLNATKNLNKTKYPNSATRRGITFILNADGTVSASGLNDNTGASNFGTDIEAFEATFSGNVLVSGGVNSSCVAFLNDATIGERASSDSTGGDVNATLIKGHLYNLVCRINKGAAEIPVATPVVFKPMIRLANDSDNTYQPYAQTNRELTVNKADNSVIGTVEDGATASQAYAVGEHFIKDGQFKEVTQPISSGGEINDSNTVDRPIADIIDTVDITTDYFDTLPNTITQSSISKVYKKGNTIILQMVLLKSDNFEAQTNYAEFATIKKKYAPKVNINTCCFLTTGEYSSPPYDIGYFYLSSAGKLSTRNQSTSAMGALKCNFTYVI